MRRTASGIKEHKTQINIDLNTLSTNRFGFIEMMWFVWLLGLD
jgi:hypothetical protein